MNEEEISVQFQFLKAHASANFTVVEEPFRV